MNLTHTPLMPSARTLYGKFARIARPKLNGFGSHEGVLLPSGLVVHLTQERGICLVTMEEFARGHKVTVRFELPPEHHDVAMQRLTSLLQENKPYDLVPNNCKMFARNVLLQRPESPQVLVWCLVAVVGLLAAS